LARLATESGLFPLFEAEYGELTSVTPIRHRVPVAEYLRPQARYAHLFAEAEKGGRPDLVARIQEQADRNIRTYGLIGEAESGLASVSQERSHE
jgi:pyruvate ferredoxin oxidoreductase beta subunit